jgi:hypothetical protein
MDSIIVAAAAGSAVRTDEPNPVVDEAQYE